VDKYAVFGNPIAQSKSPLIHSLFALQTQQELSYTAELIDTGSFADEAGKMMRRLRGANVTAPFKQDAFEMVDLLSRRARQAGAVNTIIRQADGSLMGDNTDGAGLVNDLTHNLHWVISGKRILILGAGGAVRGTICPILAQEPTQLHIANRTEEKAAQLAQAFSGMGNLTSSGFDDIEGEFDIIINGTSAGLGGDVVNIPATCIGEHTACYDMIYSLDGATDFMAYAQGLGCRRVADGLGMLVEQAAEAFELWRGVRPDTAAVIDYLRKEQAV
jgi:shikimate dehydrogenase